MSLVGLFAGIGGFEKAFGDAGFATSLMVEKDPAAQAVLAARFPNVSLHGDVRTLAKLPNATQIVTAGFPCQDLSMAGSKVGIGGGKSSVVDEMFRLIAAADVPTVVVENVYFMLQLGRGLAMHTLVARFRSLGYAWAYRIIDTQAFGLPHRRRRVYFVASKVIDPRAVLFADETQAKEAGSATLDVPLGFYWTEGRSGVGITIDGIPPLKVGSAVGISSAPAVLFPDGEVLTPGTLACERLQGFAEGWTDAALSVDKRSRGRLVGNAVSVPAANWVAERLKSPGQILDLPQTSMKPGAVWPTAAFNVGQGRVHVTASLRPVDIGALSIASFRDHSWSQLSDRALTGFLRRAREGNLRFPVGFLAALDAALARRSRQIAA